MGNNIESGSPPRNPVAGKPTVQFGIRTLLVLMLVFAIVAWFYQTYLVHWARLQESNSLLLAATRGQTEYDPASMVRAVNQLRRLKREDALVRLRAFANRYPGSDEPMAQSLEYVLPLLFDQGNESLRDSDWPKWLQVEGDLPFHTAHVISKSTVSNQDLIEKWFGKDLKFRSSPMRPVDDPFGAAQKVLAKIAQSKKPATFFSNEFIYRQAGNSVLGLIPHSQRRAPGFNTDKACRSLNVYWGTQSQKYELKK